jgi:F0F1-type ATP synthase membrane subunit a
VRLFANMFAGHVLVKVLLSLAWIISLQVCVFSTSVFFLLFLIVCVMGLELFICGLQAFVFTNLASVYLDQGVNFIAH